MRFRALLWILPLVLWPGPGRGNGLAAQEGPEEVTQLRFEGNHRFSDRVLASAIITRETECRSWFLTPFCLGGAEFSLDPSYFNPREFRRDQARLRLFYYERGYRETVVDTLVEHASDNSVRITFRIQEGDPILVTELGFSSLDEVPDSSVLRNLPIDVGDPLSLLALDATRDTLETRFRNQGFAHAEVLRNYFIPQDTPEEAQVTFGLYLGPTTYFGPIDVQGNEVVGERVIRRMLPFQAGDLYRQDLRFAGLRNLYSLDIFSYVQINPDLDHVPDTIVPLQVTVAEGDVHRVRAGGGLTTADCLNTEVRWSSRNFYGGGRRLQITGRVSNVLTPALRSPLCADAGIDQYGGLNWLASADFTQPWLFSPRNSFTGSLFGERQSLQSLYVRQAWGLNLGLTRTLGSTSALTFSFRPQLSQVTAAEVFFCSNYLICLPKDIKPLQERNRLSPVGLRLSQDRRNQVLNPTRGYSALMDAEYAADWTGSQFTYSRLLSDATWYARAEGGWVLATHLRGGVVDPGRFTGAAPGAGSDKIVHPDKRFYGGGANSVRGFPQNGLGPRVLEVRDVASLVVAPDGGEPLCTPETVNDFTCDPGGLDPSQLSALPTGGTSLLEGSMEVRFPLAAGLWEGATFLDFGQVWSEQEKVRLRELEFTPGFGVRYFSPIGPIRVDLAYRFTGAEALQVVTSQVQPCASGSPSGQDRCFEVDGTLWAPADSLAILDTKYLWQASLPRWSLSRIQLNLSIGQAF